MAESARADRELGCGRFEFGGIPAHALPGDRPRWPRDRTVAVEHTRLEVTLDIAAKGVAGTATHTVTPFNDGLRWVEFDAIDMVVTRVTVNAAPASFDYDGERLRVDLGDGRGRGERLTVAMEYSATPRIGLYFIGPDEGYPEKPMQVWTQGQDDDSRHWFPCHDEPNGRQTTEMVVTVPGTWFALSNGRLVEERANGDGTKTFHWLQERPHATYLITLAAGQFERIDDSRDGLAIDYFVEPGDGERGRLTFANTPAMIALFERVTGMPYPWAKYSQIVVRDFVFGGMENTSATTMTENVLVDPKATVDFTSDYLVSHELAHMWWGDLLTCRDWSHGWLNEGFATYFELLWDEERRGNDEYRQGVIDNVDLYLGERYRRAIVTNVFHEPIDIFDRHLYEKGALVLHMLRGVLGDDGFFRAIQRYCRDNQDRSVITQDLVDAIEGETGRNLEWFFDQWVYKAGHPQLKVSWTWDGERKVASVAVRQTQTAEDGSASVFRLPVRIDFGSGRSAPIAFEVEIVEREQTFTFALPRRPELCRFDPYNMVLKELEFEKAPAELTRQLRGDDSIAGRRGAAEALGKKGGARAVRALEAAVMRDRFWGVQVAAAKALGAERGEAAKEALLRCLRVRHPKARRAVVAALGEFRGDESVLAALRPVAARDQSWFVEAEANRSVGKLRVAGSFEVLLANLERPSFRNVVRSGCLDGLVELREERGLDVLLAAARYGAPAQSRAVAAGGLATLGQHFPARRKAVADDLTRLLDDRDFRVRVAAARGLRTLGEVAFAPALDRMADRELDGRAVRAAREAAGALRKATEAPDEVRRLRDDVEELRADNVKLRDRLARVERV